MRLWCQAAEGTSDAPEPIVNEKPVSARVAEIAHQSVDNAVSVLVPTAEWLNERNESLKASQEKIVVDACQYVSANPFKSVGWYRLRHC